MLKQQNLDGIERSRETKTKVALANHKGHKHSEPIKTRIHASDVKRGKTCYFSCLPTMFFFVVSNSRVCSLNWVSRSLKIGCESKNTKHRYNVCNCEHYQLLYSKTGKSKLYFTLGTKHQRKNSERYKGRLKKTTRDAKENSDFQNVPSAPLKHYKN